MKKLMKMVGLSAFLVLTSVSVYAEQSEMNRQGDQSNDPAMQDNQNMGSSIESKSPSSQNTEPFESEEQKAARPGGVGEEGSSFGSPSSLPPGETSPGYTGEDKKAEEREKRQQGM
ncbi:hypothetical protein [Candidatus Nitrospira allomarina]|jgi:hypothetical protein|uniref:Uncharacterized protein n=1 Tax=Candidatus Nitrospira allomarina TaxID=3020900 RepID=A0AA96G8D4_9BACT|nr:hypothetical protein [Candidatus Nitrospira allomarina]WNM56642.1 hypothetical protein PP769_11710 [Candidatus Nitrospira allomarina]